MAHVRSTVTDGTTVWNNARLQEIWQNLDDEARCSVYNNATQSIPDATLTALTFNAEDYDQGGMHSTSSNTSRVTIPSSHNGIYLMTGQIVFASNGTGVRTGAFYKNGSLLYTNEQITAISGAVTIVNVCAMASLAVADYIELFGYQNSGGALNVGSATRSSGCHLQLTKIR